ncbi:MAG: hypothetical protein LBV47_03725 [Bacteroidales bacterium]|nr:hypothetical protein [Bacteroidales bacterium]
MALSICIETSAQGCMVLSKCIETSTQGCTALSIYLETPAQGCLGVSQVCESTNVRTFVKNTVFTGTKQTKYTQIAPAGVFKVTVGHTVKHDSLSAQPAQPAPKLHTTRPPISLPTDKAKTIPGQYPVNTKSK